MPIAYFVNQYPKVSHSFIRREIQTLETLGWEISRFAVRDCRAELVDQADEEEADKTRYILQAGVGYFLTSLLLVLFTRSRCVVSALWQTVAIGWKSERGLLIHFIYFLEACVLWRWLQQTNITLVHCHFGTNSTTVAMICYWLGGPPFSFTVHGPEEFDKVSAIALPTKLYHAEFVVAISHFGRSQLFRWCFPQQWSKIHVIRCGLGEDFLNYPFTPIPNQETTQLVCVGRLTPQKGQFLLLKALKTLLAKNYSCHLILVGDGELRLPLEKQIKELDLEKNVTITGWADSATVREQILSSHLLVLPSFAEGLPVVLMEALALSRPVISTYIAGIPELVKEGKCGWLVPAGSESDLSQVLEIALQSSSQALENMGKLGSDQVKKHHSIDKEAGKLEMLFQDYAN